VTTITRHTACMSLRLFLCLSHQIAEAVGWATEHIAESIYTVSQKKRTNFATV